ncbi:SDR family NAD(P)-dependent oxidoreductase [Orbus wheelerorum]
MTHSFTFTSTTDEVLAGYDLKDKRILVTGVSSGLGIETARVLVAHGAEVVGTARDLYKAKAATKEFFDTKSNSGKFTLVELDLANLKSVRACADKLLADACQFDVIIANAGVMAPPFGHTQDGFETQFGTNHLGHFTLINRVAKLLSSSARIVVLSSAAHHIADVDLNDPNFEKTKYDRWIAYGRSKTANALFALAFDHHYRKNGIRAIAVHPGAIETGLQRNYPAAEEAALIASINATNASAGLPPFKYKTIPQGAATTVWAAIVADAEIVGGHYCEDCHMASINDSQGIHGGVSSYAS